MKSIRIILFLVINLAVTFTGDAQGYRHELDGIEKVSIVANTVIIVKAHEYPYLLIPSPENKRVVDGKSAPESEKGNDNTGFNVQIEEVRGRLNIKSLQPRFADPLIIYLPNTIKIAAENRYHTDIRLSGFQNEIEVIANHGDVILENVSGPLILDCGHGGTYITLNKVNQGSPMSIVNSHGLIDITIPANAKADLELSVPRGELHSEFDLEGIETNAEGKPKGRIPDVISSRLNQGGVSIMIYSSWGDVFVRKK